MKKQTIEYFRDKNNLSGYNYLITPKQLQEEFILDYLVNWSKKKKVKIYSHSIKRVEEPGMGFGYACQYERDENKLAKLCKYKPAGVYTIDGLLIYKIPKVDWVYYLDIYYQ